MSQPSGMLSQRCQRTRKYFCMVLGWRDGGPRGGPAAQVIIPTTGSMLLQAGPGLQGAYRLLPLPNAALLHRHTRLPGSVRCAAQVSSGSTWPGEDAPGSGAGACRTTLLFIAIVQCCAAAAKPDRCPTLPESQPVYPSKPITITGSRHFPDEVDTPEPAPKPERFEMRSTQECYDDFPAAVRSSFPLYVRGSGPQARSAF